MVVWDGIVEQWGLDQVLQELKLEVVNANSCENLKEALLDADIGLTTVDAVLADTGTLVQITNKRQNRLVSLVPPIHIALVRQSQFQPNLSLALQEMQDGILSEGHGYSAAVTLITGPSRTADIEQVLSIGVHGPKELHVIIEAGISAECRVQSAK